MELSKEQFLQIIDECLKGRKDTIETDDFTFEFGESKVTVKEKVKEEKPKRWKPELDESFYVVGTADCEGVEKWVWLDYSVDNFQYETGNCFKTKEEAEFEVARRKFMKTFKDIAYKVNDPEKTVLTYFPVWGGTKVEMLDTYGFMFPGADTVGFTSEEAYHKAMEMIDQGELHKYYFGLPEQYWT